MALVFPCHLATVSRRPTSRVQDARPRSRLGVETQRVPRPTPVAANPSVLIPSVEPAATAQQHRSLTDSWEQEQLASRRQSHAESSTSDSPDLSSSPQRRAWRQQHAQAAASFSVPDSSLPALVAPPRRAPAPGSITSSHAAAQHVSPPPLAAVAPPPPVFSAGRRPRVLEGARQLPSGVPNRIARLGRSLLHLPRGAVPGDVLQGQMLSSKQITGCAACTSETQTQHTCMRCIRHASRLAAVPHTPPESLHAELC